MPRRPSPPPLALLAPAVALLAALGPTVGCGRRAPRQEVVVFAAASLREVLGELGADFEREQGIRVVLNLAGSDTLARQIVAADGADVFISADALSMDEIERAGLLEPGTRTDIAANALVLVSRRDSATAVTRPADLAVAPYRALALADPEAVPAGRYARETLRRIPVGSGSLWDAVETSVVPTADVRAALALVASDPEIVGIVYATDARASSEVRVLHEFPQADGPAIRYVGAVIASRSDRGSAREFLSFVRGTRGRVAFERHGFAPPAPGTR